MEKIKTALKAVAIFFIMYVIISGNGDDTFFAWIIMVSDEYDYVHDLQGTSN